MTPVQKMLLASAICVAAQFRMIPSHAEDAPGAMPGDAAMTCQQIAAELAPYAKQMLAAFSPFVKTQQQLVQRNEARVADTMPALAAMTGAATAASLDPTGLSSQAVNHAEQSMQQQAWNRALAEDKPLRDQESRQLNTAMAKSAPLQSNARIQRLMQLAQEKNCH